MNSGGIPVLLEFTIENYQPANPQKNMVKTEQITPLCYKKNMQLTSCVCFPRLAGVFFAKTCQALEEVVKESAPAVIFLDEACG